MNLKISPLEKNQANLWDAYVLASDQGTYCHMWAWKEIVEKTYGHKTIYLGALDVASNERLLGILPLVHIKSCLSKGSLVSMPYLDLGGIIADRAYPEDLLLKQAISLGRKLNVYSLELRQGQCRVKLHSESGQENPVSQCPDIVSPYTNSPRIRDKKMRMYLPLPQGPDKLWQSFSAKLRNQIKKAYKEGLTTKVGGREMLDDFYNIFALNMRDLGSPVHSKALFSNVMQAFPDQAKIFTVYWQGKPLASSLVLAFKRTLENPWSSFLRQYKILNANMLLYWSMLEYACNQSLEFFNFGRSSLNSPTYRFKKQWGARELPLRWLYYSEKSGDDHTSRKLSSLQLFVPLWKKLPLAVSKIVGPKIRKYISL